MREDPPVKTYWVHPAPGVRWLCKEYFDKQIILSDEECGISAVTSGASMEEATLVIPLKDKDMGVDLEVDKLTTNLTDQVEKLTKKVAEVNDKLTIAFGDTHQTVDVVDEHVGKLASVTAKLKALVGGQTNNPPPGPLPT